MKINPKKLTSRQQVQAMEVLHQAAAAWLIGVSADSLRRSVDAPRGDDDDDDDDSPRKYSGRDLVAWAIERTDQTPGGDTMMVSSDSPALERYRLARAEGAELDIAERKQVLLRRDEVHEGLTIIAGILRRAGQRIKLVSSESHQILNDAIDDADRVVQARFATKEGEKDETRDH